MPPRGLCASSAGTPAGTAVSRKMRSPQTTGDDEPRPGISTFHLMFFVSLHSVGGSACRETPVAYGPRHCGQNFSASVSADHPADRRSRQKDESQRAESDIELDAFAHCRLSAGRLQRRSCRFNAAWNPRCKGRSGRQPIVSQLSRRASQWRKSQPTEQDLTEEQKRANVIRLVFGGDESGSTSSARWCATRFRLASARCCGAARSPACAGRTARPSTPTGRAPATWI